MTKIDLKSMRSVDQLLDAIEWCDATFGTFKRDRLRRWTGGRWYLDEGLVFVFAYGEDAMLFKLRWS